MTPFTNRYVAYKQYNGQLAHWVTHHFEAINKAKEIESAENNKKPKDLKNSKNTKKPEDTEGSSETQITHKPTVREFCRRVDVIAKHIAKNIPSVHSPPPWIFWTFLSVIEARTELWLYFKHANSEQPDPGVEKSNKSHKFFIDSLKQAFNRLGGQQYLSSQDGAGQSSQHQDAGDGVRDDSGQPVQTNRFSTLSIHGDQAESTDGSLSPPSESPTTQHHRTKKDEEHKSSGSEVENISLEGYGIIDEEDAIDLEYQMAAIALIQEWHELRCFFVHTWATVAKEEFNIAIAGAMSNIAVATVKRSEMVVSRDFPDRLSYVDFLKAVAPGVDPRHRKEPRLDSSATMSHSSLAGVLPADPKHDQNEILFIYAYQDFIEFVGDFQLRNNGDCSNKFARELNKWDPKFDFMKADRKEQRKWRRTYTIKWLYDLVNVFSSLCEKDHPSNGPKWNPREADWSFVEDRDGSRHLFGLDEFAKFACFLAWQTKSAECSIYIKPHHLFQLQIMVDSMSVSRRWRPMDNRSIPTERTPGGHSQNSTLWRDLDRFPDCESMNPMLTYLSSSKKLISRLKICKERFGDLGYSQHADIIQTQIDRFRKLRGETGNESDPTKLQQLHRRKMLWEHSPLLCGVGLLEALEIAFGTGTLLWNRIPEPVLAIHLHNMLFKKGFIKESVGLYDTLGTKFTVVFFQGTVPNSDFADALYRRIRRINASVTELYRKVGLSKPAEILAVLDKGRAQNAFVSKRLNTTLYRLANWDV